MSDTISLAVVGLGRIGAFHAQHAAELACEGSPCELTALVDSNLERARALAARLARPSAPAIRAYSTIGELLASGVAAASVVASPTTLHREHVEELVTGGHRVLLEKPLTGTLQGDRDVCTLLNRTCPNAVMLAFQRRFDPALLHARDLIAAGAIGTPFKIVSILEDSRPPPAGYRSNGLLADMSVHNVDEVLWLSGRRPVTVQASASRLYNYKVAPVEEDYDDGVLTLRFDEDLLAQVQVSRNHVSGYRTESWVFGDLGHVHVGHFRQDRTSIVVEAYGREEPIGRREFSLRDYGRPAPEFVDRFGPAYKRELTAFVECCRSGASFPVTHEAGLRAMEVIAAALESLERDTSGAPIRYCD